MIKNEGHISDFPKKRMEGDEEEETNIESGFIQPISGGSKSVNRMPGVGKDKGKGPSKYLDQFVKMLKAQEAENKESEDNKEEDKNSPK